MVSLHKGPGQWAAFAVSGVSEALAKKGIAIIIQWVPGHSEIRGNINADKLAKAAANTKSSKQYMVTNSFIKAKLKEGHKDEWEDYWRNSGNTGKNYKGPFKTKPDKTFQNNNKNYVATVTQLRTGCGYFNSYLSMNPKCEVKTKYYSCKQGGIRDAEHIITKCRRHTKERKILSESCTSAPRIILYDVLFLDANSTQLELRTFLQSTAAAQRPKLRITDEDDYTPVTAEGQDPAERNENKRNEPTEATYRAKGRCESGRGTARMGIYGGKLMSEFQNIK